MKLNQFYSECKKYAETNTPDVLEAVLKAPIPSDFDTISIKPHKRNARLYQYGVAACLIIVITILASHPNIMKQQFPTDNNPPIADNFQPTPQENSSNRQANIITHLVAGEHEDTVILSNGELYFNQVEEVGSAKIKLPEGAYKAEIQLEEYISYLGSDPRPTWLPEGMAESKKSVQLWYYENGEILDSSWAFRYSSDLENSLAKQIDIDIDKGKLPRTDIDILGEEKVSYINDTEIITGHMILDKSHEANNDFYYAEFTYNGIGYRITAERGITQEEFIKVLQSIIKK